MYKIDEISHFHRCRRRSNVKARISQGQASLKRKYLILKCRVAPIRHTIFPKLILWSTRCRVFLRKKILRENDRKNDKYLNRISCIVAVATKRQEFVIHYKKKFLEKMDQWRRVKWRQGMENPAGISTRQRSDIILRKSV